MFFRRPKKWTQAASAAGQARTGPTEEESRSLAEKYQAQVEWMHQQGIVGVLDPIKLESPGVDLSLLRLLAKDVQPR